MSDVEFQVADSLERIFPEPVVSADWDDVLRRAGGGRGDRGSRFGREQAARLRQGRHRWRVVLLAAAALIVAVASTAAFGTVRDLLFGERRTVAFASAPTWSPDGRRIAFLTHACIPDSTPGCHGPVEFNVMNADGSGQRNLTREWGLEAPVSLFKGYPVWSPDWRKVAFVRDWGGYGYSDIYVINADGSGRRRLTRSPQNEAKPPGGGAFVCPRACDGDPVWSPDGRRLAFVRVRGGRADIYVVSADGGGLRRLAHAIAFTPDPGAPSPGFSANPAWSPDGRKIAFMSNRDGTDDVFVVNADGSGLRNLTRRPADDRKRSEWYSPDRPMWSPDGRKIVFRARRDRSTPSEWEVCRPRGPQGERVGGVCARDEIYVVDADGSGLRRLTYNWKSDGAPAWSPDGRKILFLRSGWQDSANVGGDVYVMNADGSGQRNLTRSVTRPFATERAPAWSPDGRKILFVSNRDRNSEIYVMNADGSGLRKLTELKGEE
jgi:Tol biopolymer transport system component